MTHQILLLQFFTEQKPFESVKEKIKDVNEHVGETQVSLVLIDLV